MLAGSQPAYTPEQDAPMRRRLFAYSAGFFTNRRLVHMLRAAGYDLRIGLPRGPDDLVAAWGQSPTAARAEAVAARYGAGLVRVEDAFLRSLHPARVRREPPLGVLIDHTGVHFDPTSPSDLETLLATHPLDDTYLLDRAREGIARMREGHLSKYAACDPDLAPPAPGYVLLIDQTRGDASLRASGAGQDTFDVMLVHAQAAHPGARILIRAHPETMGGARAGHYKQERLHEGVEILTGAHSPWTLLEGAIAVYTVSSQMGFEAILAGHRPRVFGRPFYAGWGLTEDHEPTARRGRRLTSAQLFAAAMILAPLWWDPHANAPGSFETALEALEARARGWREDHKGWRAHGIRLWKRRHFQQIFGQHRAVRFGKGQIHTGPNTKRRAMIWGAPDSAVPPSSCWQAEDGFLRSRGLGAQLVPPLSLINDPVGIYYNAAEPSRLEEIIQSHPQLRPGEQRRIEALVEAIIAGGVSKYTHGTPPPTLPDKPSVLVVGQVANDASLRLGALGEARSNQALLDAARAARPNCHILYKPHPDVEAGLRPGALENTGTADEILKGVDPAALLPHVSEVWTLTSLLGFEALLRGVPVTVLGMPFYAGWGLTRDLGPPCPRRTARPTLEALAHAALIRYPRYHDPLTNTPCSPEIAVLRLSAGTNLPKRPMLNLLAKGQGLLSGHAALWRR